MSGPLPSLASHAEPVPIRLRHKRDQPGDEAAYAAELQRLTDTTLRRSASWRAGRPLVDHRLVCDCPPSLAGCTERWPSTASQGSATAARAHLPTLPSRTEGARRGGQ